MNVKSMNKQVVFNILSSAIISGIGFLTTPIFTRILGTVQYGKYSVFYSWVTIITCLMGMQTQTSIVTGYYDYKESYFSFRSGILLVGTIISSVFIVLSLLFSVPLANWLGYTIPIFVMLLLSSFFHYVIDFARMSLIYEKKAVLNFIISTSLSLITVFVSLLLLDNFGEDERFLSRVYGLTIPYCVIGIAVYIIIYLKKPAMPKLEYWKYSLVLGVPMVFHALSGKILGQADCIMLEKMGNISESVGLYSFYHTYTSILTVILTALNTSWLPFFFDDLSENSTKQLKIKTKHYLELFTLICIVYLLMSREVSYIFADSSYFKGLDLIPIFTLAIYFTFMYQFSVNYEMFRKKTGIIAIGTFGAAILNIILNALFIPVLDMYGAAIATTLSYLGLFIAHYYISKKLQGGKSYVTMRDFANWFFLVVITCIIFYIMKDMVIIRWVIAIMIGILCLVRVFKRRSIF